jgi:hypothetical protein
MEYPTIKIPEFIQRFVIQLPFVEPKFKDSSSKIEVQGLEV